MSISSSEPPPSLLTLAAGEPSSSAAAGSLVRLPSAFRASAQTLQLESAAAAAQQLGDGRQQGRSVPLLELDRERVDAGGELHGLRGRRR